MLLTGVRPADEVGIVIDGQTVRQAQVLSDESLSLTAIHVGGLYLRGFAVPVTPEHHPAMIDTLKDQKYPSAFVKQIPYFHSVQGVI